MVLNRVRREINLFFVALTFLTRISSPSWITFSSEQMNESARYYPLVGVVIGLIIAVCYCVFVKVFPIELSVVLSMAVGVRVTGAFHEDGFADCCDGFGAGWNKAQILSIMKDSRIGTYGAVGLLLLLLTKYLALSALAPQSIFLIIVLAHSMSRLVSVSLLYSYEYVQEDALSKVKPQAKQLSLKSLLFSITTVSPLLFGFSIGQIAILVVGLLGFRYIAGRYLLRRIGGYTGDCLGGVQQIGEVLIYLMLLIFIQ